MVENILAFRQRNLIITFAAYLYLEGPVVAVLHTAVVGTWSCLLTNIIVVLFRKLPLNKGWLLDTRTPTLWLFLTHHSLETLLY